MTLYTRLTDSAYGLSPAYVQEQLPNVSFVPGADLADWGYTPYEMTEQPEIGPGQQAVEVEPVNGVQQWSVVNGTPAVPTEVWTYQGKTVMILTTLGSLGLDGTALGLTASHNILDAVNAAIDSLPEPNRSVARENLNAPGMRRDAPLVAAMAPVIGLTDAMIDDLFIAAKSVP